MTELYVNNQMVQLSKSATIKVNSENAYFTSSGKYTMDVEIPLQGNICNSMIFKHINRMDVSKMSDTMEARLVADNKIVIDGTATITSISDVSVKIQILSGNAELNFTSKIGKVYIDELDLGRIKYKTSYGNGLAPNGVAYDMAKMSEEERCRFAWGKYGETDYVCFPIYNETKDMVYNDFGMRKISENAETVFFKSYLYSNVQKFGSLEMFRGNYLPQPYFCFIIKKIFEALGYEVVENQIDKTVLKNVFICNSRSTLILKQMLPHWELSEFLTQVEHFFGVIFVIDETSKNVRIMLRNSYFMSKDVHLNQIESAYSVDCDSNETTDISNGNVGYSFEVVDGYYQIDGDVLKKAEEKIFESKDALDSYYNGLSGSDKSKYIYTVGGKQYIHYKENDTTKYLLEVNQYRNLVRNEKSEDVDIELKIVPARMKVGRSFWEGVAYDDFFKHHYPTEGVKLNMVMIHVTGDEQYTDSSMNIQDAINQGSTKESTKDRIEVAMNDGIMQKAITDDGRSSHDFPRPFVLTKDLLAGEKNRGFSFELNKIVGRTTMYDAVYGSVSKVNTQSEVHIKFLSNKMYDTMQRFIIFNKPYVCKLIEYQVDAQGVKKEKTGYFYEYLG